MMFKQLEIAEVTKRLNQAKHDFKVIQPRIDDLEEYLKKIWLNVRLKLPCIQEPIRKVGPEILKIEGK